MPLGATLVKTAKLPPIRGFDRVGFTPEVKLMSRRPLPNALDLDLRGGLTDAVTPHAGVALLIDLGRRSGVLLAADRHLPPKKSAKGLGHTQFVEAFVLLSALGGECLDDFEPLRRDRGLAALLGYDLPAAATARPWLRRLPYAVPAPRGPAPGGLISAGTPPP